MTRRKRLSVPVNKYKPYKSSVHSLINCASCKFKKTVGPKSDAK